MASLALAFDILARDKGASKAFDKVGDSADKAGRRGEKFGKVAGAGLLIAGAAAVKFGKDSVGAATAAEESQRRLAFALEKFPKLADTNAEKLGKLNSALAKKSKFDDDAIASGQAVLGQFELTGKQLESVTPLLLDYAGTTGKAIPDAAQDVGKALLGNAKALKNIGISYKATGDRTQDFANIQQLLRDKVGGFAEKEGKTAAGQAAILKNQFGELQEKVGAKLLPVLAELTKKLLSVLDFIDRNSKVIVPLVGTLGAFAAAVVVVTQVAKAYTAVQAALNIVMAANPIVLVIAGLVLLGGALVVAYKKSETFRDVVKGAFEVVLKTVDKFLAGLGFLFRALGNVPGFGWADKAAKQIENARKKVQALDDALDRLPRSKVVEIVTKFSQLGSGTSELGAIGRNLLAGPPVGRRALGGPVSRNQPYLVGERGPELLLPNTSGRIVPNNKLGGLTINTLNVTSGPSEDASQSVPRALRNLAFSLGV